MDFFNEELKQAKARIKELEERNLFLEDHAAARAKVRERLVESINVKAAQVQDLEGKLWRKSQELKCREAQVESLQASNTTSEMRREQILRQARTISNLEESLVDAWKKIDRLERKS